MKRADLALAALVLMGCGSPLRAATETANGVKVATLAASEVLTDECLKKVEALPSKTPEERAESLPKLAALQTVCDPLSGAYRVARLSHATLVAAIAAGEQTDPAALTRRVLEAATAAAKLADAIDKIRRPR